MKFILLVCLIIQLGSNEAARVNKKLLPFRELECSLDMAIAFEIVTSYFKLQHSVALVDFSDNPVISSMKCKRHGTLLPILHFDNWLKVNLGEKIHDSGLSAYSTTRGFFIKSGFKDIVSLLPMIAEFNPRGKLLFSLDFGSFEEAKELLELSYHIYEMLDVAVLLYFPVYDNGEYFGTTSSLCLFNPFTGNLSLKPREFKCFNFTKTEAHFKEMDHFIKNRVRNLNQHPLHIDIFEEVMLSKAVRNANGMITNYIYPDGDTVTYLARMMNFQPIYINAPDDTKYGFKRPNGSFSGSLGSLEHGKADYAAIPFFIADYKTKKSLFLKSIAMKDLKFIIRRKEVFKMFGLGIFYQFDFTAKTVGMALFLLLPGLYCLVYKGEANIFKVERQKSFVRNAFYTLALMGNISSKHSDLPASRILVVAILFFSLMISSIFQGNIIKNLNSNMNIKTIATVAELKAENYNFIIEKSMATIFSEQGGSVLGNLLKNMSQNPSYIVESAAEGIKKVLREEKIALLGTGTQAETLNSMYDKETGENYLEEIDETVFEFFVSPMAPKTSPFIVRKLQKLLIITLNILFFFKESFNYWLSKYQELGFQGYELERALFDIRDVPLINRIKNGHICTHNGKTIQLHDLYSIFVSYLLINFVSLIVFLAEISMYLVFGKISKALKKNESSKKEKEKSLNFLA